MATLEAPTRISLPQGTFRNEPATDFSKEEHARRMRDVIAKVRSQLGHEYDLVIGGKRVKTEAKIKSINPAKPSEVVGLHQKAGREHAEPACVHVVHESQVERDPAAGIEAKMGCPHCFFGAVAEHQATASAHNHTPCLANGCKRELADCRHCYYLRGFIL